MTDVKIESMKRGLTSADVANMYGFTYTRYIKVINGFVEPNEEENQKIRDFMSGKAVGDG